MKSINSIDEALADIAAGKMVIVVDDEDRENEGDLIMAASKATAESVNFMAREGRGLICVPLTEGKADELGLRPMVAVNTERMKTNFTVSVDYKEGLTTGISMKERANTINALASNAAGGEDFVKPGHVFPLRAKDSGVLVRAGHTEAAVDLVRLAGLPSAGVLCEIIKDDGEMARLEDLKKFASKHDLKIVSIKHLIEYRRRHESLIEKVSESELPTEYGDFRLVGFRSLFGKQEHVALVKGDVAGNEPVLTRVHSECLTGEVFKSKRCDCGSQLDKSLQMIANAERGVLLYMKQEGRGIGLMNKIKAYKLQDDGMDTVEANKKMGFKADLREYGIGAQILSELGIEKIDLLTNNPKKIVGLEGYGLTVERRLPIEILPTEDNRGYLAAKKALMGHILQDV